MANNRFLFLFLFCEVIVFGSHLFDFMVTMRI